MRGLPTEEQGGRGQEGEAQGQEHDQGAHAHEHHEDEAESAERIAPADEGSPGETGPEGHVDVSEAHALVVRVEKELLGVVVVAGQMEPVEVDVIQAQDSRLRVFDGPAGEGSHEAGEDRVADPAHEGPIRPHPAVAVAVDEVGLVAEEGPEHRRDLGGLVLQVGVELDHEVGPRAAGGEQPGAYRGPEPPPGRQGEDAVGSGLARHSRRLVTRAVVHHEHERAQTERFERRADAAQGEDDLAHARRFVAGRDHADQGPKLAHRRGASRDAGSP